MLFTFPSRYSFTIGRQEYLALEGGPPGFPRDYTGPAVLKLSPNAPLVVAYGAFTRSGRAFQHLRLTSDAAVGAIERSLDRLTTPRPQRLDP